MRIGEDKNNVSLETGDICKFVIDDQEYEGIIAYDEGYFAYTFEMLDDKFSSVLMSKAEYNSIEKIQNVWEVESEEPKFIEFRKLARIFEIS